MAKSSRIILHVGAPKTGSTYLQRRLRIAPDLLRRHGIYVPVLPIVARMAGNAKLLPITLDQNPSPGFRRAFPDIDVRDLDPAWVVSQLLIDWHRDSESLVLSAENLRPHHAQTMRNMLPIDATYTVVLFVRRQDKWVDSYYNQRVKSRLTHEDISSFVSRLCAAEQNRLCYPDWYAHYSAWSAAFGQCEVVFYDEVGSDLFGAFLTAAGLNRLPDLPEIERVQVSLDLHQLAYLLQLNPKIALREFARRRAASSKASKYMGRRGSYSLLSHADRSRLRDRYQPSNDLLMTALGRVDQPSVLDMAAESPNYCDLQQLYESRGYAYYRKLANAIYASSNRLSHWLRT